MYESNSKISIPPAERKEHEKWIFEMKSLVIRDIGEIDPHKLPKYIRDSIRKYCVDKRYELHEIIRQNLTNTDPKSGSMTPKAVKDAWEMYNYFVDWVNVLFKVIDDSVDPLNFIASEFIQ